MSGILRDNYEMESLRRDLESRIRALEFEISRMEDRRKFEADKRSLMFHFYGLMIAVFFFVVVLTAKAS